MSELEHTLNKILEEHQHESGLHMIGGRQRLLSRLVQFFEADSKKQTSTAKAGKESQN